MSIKGSEDVKKEYISQMGESLGILYYHINQELILLFSKWKEFKELFGTKSKRVDLLNETAPYFFRIVQDVMWENIIMSIARITDPPKSMNRYDNLTIKRFKTELTSRDLKQKVEKIILEIEEATQFCRDWRNRKFGHLDLKLAIGEETKELEPATRNKTQLVFNLLLRLMNEIYSFYFPDSIMLEPFLMKGTSLELLYYLKSGLRQEEERNKRLQKGEFRPGDFETPDI